MVASNIAIVLKILPMNAIIIMYEMNNLHPQLDFVAGIT